MTVVAALAAANAGKLAAGTKIVDTARNVADNVDQLQGIVGLIGEIDFSNGGLPGFAITAAQLTSDAGVLALIAASSPYLLYQRITAAQASTAILAGGFRDLAVVDTAANVIANLPALEALWKAGKLSSIRLTDGGTPALALTAAQVGANVDALAAISGTFSIALTDPGTPTVTLPSWATYISVFTNVTGVITTPFTLAFNGVIRTVAVASAEVGLSYNTPGFVSGLPANPIAPFGAASAKLLPTGLQVLQYSGQITNYLDSLQIAAQAGKLTSITLRDPGVQSLSLTPLTATNDALALSKLSPNYYLSQIVTVAQAATATLAAGFFNFTVQDSAANILADLTSGSSRITALGRVGQLARLRFVEPAPDIKLTAAQLGQAAFGLSFAGEPQLTITLTDGGTPTVTISADLLNVFSVRSIVLSHITTPYHLVISGAIYASLASTIVAENTSLLANLTSVSVLDYPTNITPNLDALQTLAAAGKLASVNISNGGVPALAITAATQAADSLALAKITSPYTIAPTYSASGLVSALATLEAQAESNTLGTITLTGTGTQVISVTAAQLQANLSVFGKIGSSYSITLTGASTTLSLQGWQITTGTLNVLSKITGSYTFAISGAISAFNASALGSSLALSHMTGTVAVQDYDTTLGSNLDGVQKLAAAGGLGTVTVLNGVSARIPVSVAQLTADAGALAAISGSPGRVLRVAASAVAGTVLPAGGLTQMLVQDSLSNVLANLAAIQTVAAAGNLRGISLISSAPFNINLPAATVSANIDALSAFFNTLNVTLSDGGTPTITIAGGELSQSQVLNLLNRIGSAYSLVVTGSISASAASNLAINYSAVLSRLASPLVVVDESWAIGSSLTGLQILAVAGKLASITLADGGVMSLNLSPGQIAAGATALSKIVTPHSNAFTTPLPQTLDPTSGAFLAQLGTLEASADNGTLGGVTLSGPSNPVLSLTSTTVAADLAALAQISGSYTISVTAQVASDTSRQPEFRDQRLRVGAQGGQQVPTLFSRG